MRQATRDPGVVVGVDGSEPSRQALEWAACEASRRGVTLGIAHAFPVDVSAARTEDPPALRGAAERLLAEAADHARGLVNGVSVVQALLDGPPARALVRESEHVSLLVVGSRGQGGFVNLLLGSTAVNVAAQAACPVVVMPRPEARGPLGTDMGPVAVGTDASPRADRALEFAFARAQDRNVAVIALYAWQLPDSYSAYPIRELLRGGSSRAERDACARLADAVGPWQRRYPTVAVDQHVVLGQPVNVLADASSNAQVIVVGSRGRGSLAGLVLGSVSQGLLRHTQCPVLVVR